MRQLKIHKSITNRESPSIEKYLQEIGKIDLLEPEEEEALAKCIRTGGQGSQEALEKLTKANLRFVVSVAKQYQNQGLSLGDLINEGNLGLVKAAKRFDETKGFKFISYAVWRIRQSILQALVEQSRIVRMPMSKVGLHKKINDVSVRLEQVLERSLSPEEIAQELGVDDMEVQTILNHISTYPISLEASFDDSGLTLLDIIANDEEAPNKILDHDESLKQEIEAALSGLDDRAMDIVKLYFGIGIANPMRLEEIGAKYGLTRERVRQIKDIAIAKLRTPRKLKKLKTFLS